MRSFIKKLFVLFLVAGMLFSAQDLYAQDQKEKGAIVRFWERFRSRWVNRQQPAVEKQQPVPVLEEVKIISEEEKIEPQKEPTDMKTEPTQEVKDEIKEQQDAAKRRFPEIKITLSDEEMVESMRARLKTFPQIADMIPEVFAKESPEGEKEYYYKPRAGVTLRFTELDNKTLQKLYRRINGEATRINTERLLRQIHQQDAIIRRRLPQQPPRPQAAPPRAPVVPKRYN